MKRTNLTSREYEVMNILWNSDKPMLTSDILPLIKMSSTNSIFHIMNNLLDMGYVKIVGNVKVVKVSSRLYAPAVTVAEYAAIQLKNIFKTSNSKMDVKNLLYCLTKRNKNDKEAIIQDVEDFINELKDKQRG